MRKKQIEELDSPKQISKPNRIKRGVKNQRPVKKAKTPALIEEKDDEFIDDDEFEIYEDTEEFK
jgi:hypothetical protein